MSIDAPNICEKFWKDIPLYGKCCLEIEESMFWGVKEDAEWIALTPGLSHLHMKPEDVVWVREDEL